jgi:BMFP domain-containing protein YqiC
LEQKITMMEQFIQAMLEQLQQPRTDLEKNLRALFAEWVERLDLVSRAELERQEMQLIEAQRTISALSQQLDRLEAAQQQQTQA